MAQPHGALTRVASARKYADGGFVDDFSPKVALPQKQKDIDAATYARNTTATKPTDAEMAAAWNANRSDPAKVYELMQQHNVGVNDVAKMLGADRNAVAQYLNTGRKRGTAQTGYGDDLGWVDDNRYAEVHPERETKDEFLKRVEPWMLDASGKFKGPQAGVNYRYEGMTPDQVYDPGTGRPTYATHEDMQDNGKWDEAAIAGRSPALDTYAYLAETRGGTYGGGGSTKTTGSWEPINLKWEPGPDTGGGALGGVGRAIGNTATGIVNNPALMAALTAGVGQMMAPSAGAGATAGGTGTGGSAGIGSGTALGGGGGAATASMSPLQSFMASPWAKPAISGGKTLIAGGSPADALKSAAGTYMGNEVGSSVGKITDSPLAGSTANTLMQSAVRGNLSGQTINGLATQYASGQLTDLTGLPPQVASIVINLAKNKKVSPVGALTAAANLAQSNQRRAS